MTKKVFKYPVDVQYEQVLKLPLHSEILHVDEQNGEPVLWALVNPEEQRTEERRIRIYGTGHPIPEADKLQYVNTWFLARKQLVWHVFEVVA